MITENQEKELVDELRNFQEIAALLKPSPGNIPRLQGVDIHGASMPLKGAVGGDHLIYIDFNKRYDLPRRIREAEAQGRPEVAARLAECQHRAGILLADASGHKATDGLIGAMLHQAFLLGVYYELDRYGEITTKLFENVNQRFFRSTGVNKYLTMLYGEVSEEGRFRFVSAGHPKPRVFSREFGRFAELGEDRLISFPPIGMFPTGPELIESVDPGPLGFKERYQVNEIDLLAGGDVLLLYTDGLLEHADHAFFREAVEPILAESQGESAEWICDRLRSEIHVWGPPQDDISFVVVKKGRPADSELAPSG